MASDSLVFVYGALRSGTTLLRLMLDTHPRIQNPGEADFLFDFLHRAPDHPTGWRYDREALAAHRIFRQHRLDLPDGCDGIDLFRHLLDQWRARAPQKVLILNIHRHASVIAQIAPEARIIHLLRDPRDVARSCVGMGWNGISFFGIDSWLKTEQDWDRAGQLHQNPVLTVRFETLMQNIDGELQRVCAFLNLPFAPDMLRYHENTTYGPPDPSLADQWKRKASRTEVALMEGKCGDMITARGYTLSSYQPYRPGAVRWRVLSTKNRLLRWRYNAKRFGLSLFLGSHAARLLRLQKPHRALKHRIDVILDRSMK